MKKRVITPDYNLAVCYPKIAELYSDKNPDKANEVFPNLTAIRIWYRKECGHEWRASPHAILACFRNKPDANGCPYCAGKRVDITNCAATSHPWMTEFYDTDLNLKTLHEITIGSHIKRWWKCKYGHKWQATLSHMRESYERRLTLKENKGVGCLVCHSWVVDQSNCAATTHPWLIDLFDENANTKTLYELTANSDQKLFWTCRYGHVWEARIRSITNKQSKDGCPHCSPSISRPQILIYAEMKYLFEDAQLGRKINKTEFDVFIPSINLAIEYDGFPWHKNRMNADLQKNQKAIHLGIKLVRVRDNRNGRLADNDILVDSPQYKVNFKTFIKPIAEQVMEHLGDNHQCSRKIKQYIIECGFRNYTFYKSIREISLSRNISNNITFTHPEKVKEWDYSINGNLNPEMFTRGSSAKVGWICSKGHRWIVAIALRCLQNTGCPQCNKTRPLSQSEITNIKQLRAAGLKISAICERTNRSYPTVKKAFGL